MTMQEFIKAHKITMTAEWADSNPNMEDSGNMDHWKCILKMGRKRLTVPFSMGIGHNGKAPKVEDVLDCMASDSSGIDNTTSFEDWCADYGYDTDSRKAERTFRVCERQAQKLRAFIGDNDYETLLYDTERL